VIAPYPPDEIPLRRLRPGQPACVTRIAGPTDDVHRLEEFGLRPGTKIEMFRPGSPCILRLAGSKVCLRTARRVQVFVTPAAPQG
jgi:ferrous iron transport protein A